MTYIKYKVKLCIKSIIFNSMYLLRVMMFQKNRRQDEKGEDLRFDTFKSIGKIGDMKNVYQI